MTAQTPRKFDLFGVAVSAADYDQTVGFALQKHVRGESAVIDLIAVHGLIEAVRNNSHRKRINHFDIAAPDGQPIRWSLNGFHKTQLSDRVYGPELMLRLCAQAAKQGISIYLYGSKFHVIRKLERNLLLKFPSLRIVGTEAPPFRPLSTVEDHEVVRRINNSGAGFVFIGLGCPRQEIFASEHSNSIHAVQICVGAAFDFHAATLKMAPAWMQRNGLEWLFRLAQEPGRLGRRYLVTNTVFILLVIHKIVFGRRKANASADAAKQVQLRNAA